MTQRKLCLIFISFLMIFTSCRKTASSSFTPRKTWYAYSDFKNDSIVYVAISNNIFSGVFCGKSDDYFFSSKINRNCSAGNFSEIKTKLEKLGYTYIGTAPEPNTDGYPDLSKFAIPEVSRLWNNISIN